MSEAELRMIAGDYARILIEDGSSIMDVLEIWEDLTDDEADQVLSLTRSARVSIA